MTHEAAVMLLRDHVLALLNEALESGHSRYCRVMGKMDPLSPRCDCGQKELIGDALIALRKTSPKGKHHFPQVDPSPACVKCGGEPGVDVGPTCPSEEGL